MVMRDKIGDKVCFPVSFKVGKRSALRGTFCEASPLRSVSGRGGTAPKMQPSPQWPTFTWNDELEQCNTANLRLFILS